MWFFFFFRITFSRLQPKSPALFRTRRVSFLPSQLVGLQAGPTRLERHGRIKCCAQPLTLAPGAAASSAAAAAAAAETRNQGVIPETGPQEAAS